MNWLTNFVRPKIRALVAPSDTRDTLWVKCPGCEAMVFHRDLTANLQVCPECNHHMRLPVRDRLALLFDGGTYDLSEPPKVAVDPLRFRDSRRYTERLREAQNKTGRSDAILVASGTIGGLRVVAAALDFEFMGGSMGLAVGEGFCQAANLAVLKDAAFIAIPSTGGARMQEGILSLMQMPRTVIAVQRVREAGLPYIVLLTDPTTGGVTASFAMLGDLHIAEPGARIGFAGARVIEETIRQTLPDGFQRAEYLRDHGMVDMVVHRRELRGRLVQVLDLLRRPVVEEVTAEATENGNGEGADAAAVGEAMAETAPERLIENAGVAAMEAAEPEAERSIPPAAELAPHVDLTRYRERDREREREREPEPDLHHGPRLSGTPAE
ncbi:MAG: acetyl-CoA carboxylase carboxyltransferase subunit beta [Rhodospirillaceae bacterium]|nr:acetyl-CoA carboxylase carboxyltransferase subunit beta [Rhodospirillaceae bacterium]